MKRKTLFISVILILLCSCSNAGTKKSKNDPGVDAEYFLALKSLSKNNTKEARTRLNKAVKKGTPLVARRAAEALCSTGDVQQRVESAKKLVASYNDDEAKLTACKVFNAYSETAQIVSITEGLNILEAPDELVALRLRAMSQKKLTGVDESLVTWFMEKPLSKEHLKLRSDLEENLKLTPDDNFLADFRTQVYKKDYQAAFLNLEYIDVMLSRDKDFVTDQLMSDIGKTHMYASEDLLESAAWFDDMAEKCKGTSLEFYCWFYSARMYDKTGKNSEKVLESYTNAVKCTDNLQKKDNALWYLLRASLKESNEKCIQFIEENLDLISDPSYYDDFFDLFSQILVSAGKYKEIGKLYKMLLGHASKETVAKYAYIYGRLIQEGIYKPDGDDLKGKSVDDEMAQALHVALDSATDMYYKIQAVNHLLMNDYDKEEYICAPKRTPEFLGEKGIINSDADKLLSGYAAFGFPEKIYSEWNKLGQPLITEETTIRICRLLQKCSDGKDDYYPQSLRIAARYVNYSPLSVSKELLQYCFPKCYDDLITKYARQNKVDPDVMFALVRSESFFDADIESSAGAVGLCQLMRFTAQDVAKRFKETDYDLLDPETNIKYGTWYLGNLISRLDGNYLDAFYSYNAGITRVRKWKQSSAVGFGLKDIPEDLFLETLPYTETREYGRKLVSATEIYKWLYK